ncbi:cupin 2, conserved barrel domain protein [Basidiobolus meristosporus CBS 931.73]|uniref:Cupin 2, conserved barrel domain protein n=1 Tax=Basidiobolus meristosporus CBS 931.73 TaxID=1314790 RepID=A0A1Y1YVB7_9FUNG|nr:cupin 2, conserved barrel domain protein [Basidiobolus meristosporus CBS 931.73]|eukprot:ORY01784.1 cupin 2, conserved barrel domain protein [Basidiobolus meristosporus CBS 931.73]
MIVSHLESLENSSVSHDPDVSKRVLLKNGDLPNITQFAQAILKPGQISSMHCHQDMSEVFFVQSGVAEMEVDSTLIPLSPGSSVTVRPKEKHEIRNTGNEDLVLLYFGVLDNSRE